MNLSAPGEFAEDAFRLGPGDRLAGVLTTPRGRPAADIGVILLSAGLVHRVGPFRLHVTLARQLAAQGFAVLRLDQTGVGESEIGDGAFNELRHADVGAAIDAIAARTGARRCVVVGLCSGADDILNVAPHEPRIAGAVLIDGPAWPDVGHRLRYLLPRLLNPAKWLNWLRKPRVIAAGIEDFRDFPPRADAPALLAGLVARGSRFLFVYTGGAYEYFNYCGQFASNYGAATRADGVTLEYWPDCDHTFYATADRQHLIDTLGDWLRREVATPASTGAGPA